MSEHLTHLGLMVQRSQKIQTVGLENAHAVLSGEIESCLGRLLGLFCFALTTQPCRVTQACQGPLERQSAAIVGFEQFSIFRFQIDVFRVSDHTQVIRPHTPPSQVGPAMFAAMRRSEKKATDIESTQLSGTQEALKHMYPFVDIYRH